jgi:hypothetical protein
MYYTQKYAQKEFEKKIPKKNRKKLLPYRATQTPLSTMPTPCWPTAIISQK